MSFLKLLSGIHDFDEFFFLTVDIQLRQNLLLNEKKIPPGGKSLLFHELGGLLGKCFVTYEIKRTKILTKITANFLVNGELDN